MLLDIQTFFKGLSNIAANYKTFIFGFKRHDETKRDVRVEHLLLDLTS